MPSGRWLGPGPWSASEAEGRLLEATTLPPEEAVGRRSGGAWIGGRRTPAGPADVSSGARWSTGTERPVIEITIEEHAVNDQAIAALAADPDLYQRGNMLVRVLRAGPLPDDMVAGRDPGAPTIIPVHAATLRERLTKYASWVKLKREGDGEGVLAPAHPPEWSVAGRHEPRARGRGCDWLEGVSETPLFRADGTVLDDPGYDRRRPASSTFPRSVPEGPRRTRPGRMPGGREDVA